MGCLDIEQLVRYGAGLERMISVILRLLDPLGEVLLIRDTGFIITASVRGLAGLKGKAAMTGHEEESALVLPRLIYKRMPGSDREQNPAIT